MSTPFQTVALHTLGCKVNFADSSTIGRSFREKGLNVVGFDQPSDIYVINTCSVTENANKKCRYIINKIKKLNKHSFIAVTGCYAQLKPKEIMNIEGVNLVVGAQEKFNLVDQILNSYNNGILVDDIKKTTNFTPTYSLEERTRSFLKVQDGCSYNCSFCTIPIARGISRSGTIEDILNTTNEIYNHGIKEVVLTGINLGDFESNGNSLIDLLQALDDQSLIRRFRISSIEPNLLSDEIINFISSSESFLPHFHMPLQSGSNKILRMMKRRYNKEFYLDRLNKIKHIIPLSSIGADVIVGFPSETDSDFLETYDLIEKSKISYLHVFSYSERENTNAISISPSISQCERNKRSDMLRKLSSRIKNNFINVQINKETKVLVESVDDGICSGLSENYLKVNFKGKQSMLNQILNVMIVSNSNGYISGEVI